MKTPRTETPASASEKTPLFLPSPSSTEKPAYTSIPQTASGNSLYHDADDRSTGSFELQIPAALVGEEEKKALFHEQQKKSLVCTSRCGKAVFAGFAVIAVVWSAILVTRPASSVYGPVNTAGEETNHDADAQEGPPPFSFLDPVLDMNLYKLERPEDTSPSHIIARTDAGEAIPTNQWFENLMLNRGEPTALQRAYTVPYVVDVVGPIPGIQVYPPHIQGSKTVVQLLFVETHGLTLGVSTPSDPSTKLTHEYTVTGSTTLGISLEWDVFPMSSSLVRGMPYATMLYPASADVNATAAAIVPTIASNMPFRGQPIIDGKKEIKCDDNQYHVKHEVELTVDQSDFTWVAFFSRPVMLSCNVARTQLYFEPVEELEDKDLVARVALLSNCTASRNPQYCNGGGVVGTNSDYGDMIRKHKDLYPGSNTNIKYAIDDEQDSSIVTLDWDAQSMSGQGIEDGPELISYALPHQLDQFDNSSAHFCTPVMLGRACIVKGSTWDISEPLPRVSFLASRPPRPSALLALTEALKDDLTYEIPDNYMRGAGDTYFSGKMLAKMGRILVIADEVRDICTQPDGYVADEAKKAYAEACAEATIPTQEETHAMFDLLRAGVEIWINGTAEAPFVYDPSWGGLVSCGCYFNGDTQSCDNIFPNCPVLDDPGLNFGNGFYNDHHFHYGYHVYSAAVVAKYDAAWGRKHFEQVKLLIRDFANPSPTDSHFPLFRHKDWYEGHSWASGITLPPYLNGKNQESSSEAIAAYEAVALFGKVMVEAWKACPGCMHVDKNQLSMAQEIKNVGRLLTATEMRVTDRYWHVRLHDESLQIYPKSYSHNVVGILWNTMAQFQTWFGNAPFLPYGIQLLPITAIAEQRDDQAWLKEMYKPFADACNADEVCEEQGWSVVKLGVMAAVGHIDIAMERAQSLPSDVFESAGGNGHSRSNTMWFIATRPDVEKIVLPKSDTSTKIPKKSINKTWLLTNCDVPETCTEEVLNRDADGFTCKERMQWLVTAFGKPQHEACATVAGMEFPIQCGDCNPGWNDADDDSVAVHFPEDETSQCPPCPDQICNSDLNRCPIYDRTFVCTEGANFGGCQGSPWGLEPWQCNSCCELSDCPVKVEIKVKKVMDPAVCPPCKQEVCRSRLNLCPADAAPYLCTSGPSAKGCSPRPWDLVGGDCRECCTILEGCANTLTPLD